jgi:hypothetical protein
VHTVKCSPAVTFFFSLLQVSGLVLDNSVVCNHFGRAKLSFTDPVYSAITWNLNYDSRAILAYKEMYLN